MSYDSLERSRDAGAPVELYRFRMGGLYWYLTSGDQAVTFQGHLYAPETVTREALQYGSETASGGLVVHLPRVHPVAQLFVAGMPTQPVTLTVYRYHPESPNDVVGLPPGQITAWDWEGTTVKLSCASVSQLLERRVPNLVIQPQCAWALYGPNCRVPRSAHTDAGAIAALSGRTVTVTLAAPRADGWFTGGYLQTASGRQVMIVLHQGDTVTLLTRLDELAVGDAVELLAGCDRQYATCRDKFGNELRFMGWPGMPTQNPFTRGV